MKPKRILITGATDGIGRALSEKLAEEGHQIILHGRNLDRLKTIAQEIQLRSRQNTHFFCADLFDFQEVSQMCEQMIDTIPSLDVIIHNAGTFESEFICNSDGIEKTFAVNYVSHVLMNQKLEIIFKKNHKERLQRKEPLRIILVSSIAHHNAKVSLKDWFCPENYHPFLAYANSKMAQIMYGYEVAEMYKKNYITVNSLHPGVIDTKILRNHFGMRGAPVSHGIQTPYYLAISEEVKNITGKYFINKKVEPTAPETYNADFRKELLAKTQDFISKYL